MLGRFVSIGLLLIILAACSSAEGEDGEQVHIRIRNDSDRDIERFWLGAGGTGPAATAYGAIPQGETSEYIALPAELARYNKSDFVVPGGKRFLNNINPADHVGSAALPPGRYTFAYTIQGDQATLTITKD